LGNFLLNFLLPNLNFPLQFFCLIDPLF